MPRPKRKRRASDSSVDTIDEDRIRWLQETSVLKTRPKGEEPDDHPVFELRDAVVLSSDGTQLENGLHVGSRGPYIVRVIMRVRTSTPIEIRHCVAYSVGLSLQGLPVIWLKGKGGWYEINPAPAYQSIYKHMCQGTTMYYAMEDYYSNSRPKSSKKRHSAKDDLDQALFEYSVRAGDGCTLKEAYQRCLDQALFLVWAFTDPINAHMDWHTRSIFTFLHHEKQDVFSQVDAARKNPRKFTASPSVQPPSPHRADRSFSARSRGKSASLAAKDSDVEQIDATDFAIRQRSRITRSGTESIVEDDPSRRTSAARPIAKGSRTEPAHATDLPPVDRDHAAFASVVSALETIYQEQAQKGKTMTLSTTSTRLYFEYRFPTYKDGTVGCHKRPIEEVLHYNAEALIDTLDEAQYENHELWQWLKSMIGVPLNPVAMKPAQFPFTIIPRTKAAKPRGPASHDIDIPMQVPVRHGSGPSTPQVPRGKFPGRTPGKKSALRPPGRAYKRHHDDIESGDDSDSGALKRSHYFEGDEHDSEASGSSDDINPISSPLGTAEDLVQIDIISETIPSTVPKGPSDSWVCEQEGCDYLVRGLSEEVCQERIEQHLRDHEDRTNRVNLAMTEGRGQPINHLLEKLKSIGEMAQRQGEISIGGTALPQPIKRKLLV